MLKWKRIPANSTIIVGILFLFILDKLFQLMLTFTFIHWIFIVPIFLSIHLFKRNLNRKNIERELENRRLNIKRQRNLNDLKEMDWFDFESFVCDIFNELGYEAHLTQKTDDRGKDILIYKNDFHAVAECKRFSKTLVTRPDIQKFHSAVIDCNADKDYFITTSNFN